MGEFHGMCMIPQQSYFLKWSLVTSVWVTSGSLFLSHETYQLQGSSMLFVTQADEGVPKYFQCQGEGKGYRGEVHDDFWSFQTEMIFAHISNYVIGQSKLHGHTCVKSALAL